MDSDGRELAILDRVSYLLGSSRDLDEQFAQIMRFLVEQTSIRGAALVLRDNAISDSPNDGLSIVAAVGLSDEEKARGRYVIGEGITGQVVRTGERRIVPDVTKAADFLDRTGVMGRAAGSERMSFICVPIKSEQRVHGAISVSLPFADQASLEADGRLLSLVGLLISEAVGNNQLARMEKHQWEEKSRLQQENLKEKFQFKNIIGTSEAMMEVFATIGQVAASRATVLLIGETGTGKELIAKAIHYNSPRRDQPFVRVNCGALSPTLLESELFGHVKGAFTGAVRDKIGRFEAADGGSLLLDEIGTLDPQLQVKLLRVLQEREFERVGDHRTVHVDVRMIAATNLDLTEEVGKGTFREDLYYRLNVVSVYLPPLWRRREDIPPLIDHFLGKYNAENNRNLRHISGELMSVLVRYQWPGNVRELENAIERAVVMSESDTFTEELLPLQIRVFARQVRDQPAAESIQTLARKLADQATGDPTLPSGEIYDVVISEVEKQLIGRAMDRHGGVKTKSADYLGINRNTLNKKVKDLEIPAAD